MKNEEPMAANPASLSTAGFGVAVIVRGVVVAWFPVFAEYAEDWCRENFFGEWLLWRAKPPELVPLTPAEYEEAMRDGEELAARFKNMPETPNA